jgi:hypothetical protein
LLRAFKRPDDHVDGVIARSFISLMKRKRRMASLASRPAAVEANRALPDGRAACSAALS